MSERFQRDRWSLYLEFDSIEAQRKAGSEYVLGEKAAVEARVLETFGGLPEEYAEIVMHHGDGRMEITSNILDWLAEMLHWVLYHTNPREAKLVRNVERGE